MFVSLLKQMPTLEGKNLLLREQIFSFMRSPILNGTPLERKKFAPDFGKALFFRKIHRKVISLYQNGRKTRRCTHKPTNLLQEKKIVRGLTEFNLKRDLSEGRIACLTELCPSHKTFD